MIRLLNQIKGYQFFLVFMLILTVLGWARTMTTHQIGEHIYMDDDIVILDTQHLTDDDWAVAYQHWKRNYGD